MEENNISQAEIDTLIGAIENGDIESRPKIKKKTKTVKPYNFKNPQKFSKDHLRTLEKIHDNFTRMIGNYLSTQLRKNVRVNLQGAKQTTYQEFIKDIPNTTVMSFFKLPPLQGNIMVGISYEFAYQILEILLGGSGGRKITVKEFTDIEKNIISKVTSGFTNSIADAWKNIIPVEPKFTTIETNPSANQILAPNEPVALLNFTVSIDNISAWINICIPYLCIEKFIDKLIIEYWFKAQDNDSTKTINYIEEALKPVPVEVKAKLGAATITVDEFLNLSKGDIIKLDEKIYTPTVLEIEGIPCYLSQPGITKKNSAVQIIDCIKGEEWNND